MNGDDGHTFTEAHYTACKRGDSLVPIEYSTGVQHLGGMLRRARGLRESDATVTSVPVNLRIRNEMIISILSFSPPQQAEIPEQESGSQIIHDSSSRNRAVAKRDRRALPCKMTR